MKRKNKRKAKRGLLLVLAISALIVTSAQAELITIAIEAEVNGVSDPAEHLEGKIGPGSLITGQYIFESTEPDSNPSPTAGVYLFDNISCGLYLSVGGFDFYTDASNIDFAIGITNDPDWDIYAVSSLNNLSLSNGVSLAEMFWQLENHSGTALSSDDLPTVAPKLSDWDNNLLHINGGPRESDFTIVATVTSAELVPEPATILLLLIGTALLRKRTL